MITEKKVLDSDAKVTENVLDSETEEITEKVLDTEAEKISEKNLDQETEKVQDSTGDEGDLFQEMITINLHTEEVRAGDLGIMKVQESTTDLVKIDQRIESWTHHQYGKNQYLL